MAEKQKWFMMEYILAFCNTRITDNDKKMQNKLLNLKEIKKNYLGWTTSF